MRKHPLRPDENSLGGFRSSDPGSSRAGAIDAYPRTGSQRHKALMAVAQGSDAFGVTYADVERITGIRGIWKRLSELKRSGWICVEGTRIVPDTNSQADVYFLTAKGWKWIKENEGVFR